MNLIRPGNILLLSLAIATAGLIALFLKFEAPASNPVVDWSDLEKNAAQRFTAKRGLSPCEPYARELLRSAHAKLIREGSPPAYLIAVIAPTFDELKIISLEDGGLRSYRLKGQTGFNPPSSAWFSGPMQTLSHVKLAPAQSHNVVTALSRSARYAMTAREYGYDGISYYLGNGDDLCAFTSHPRQEGPAALVTQLLEEAARLTPSAERITTLAASIDDNDASP